MSQSKEATIEALRAKSQNGKLTQADGIALIRELELAQETIDWQDGIMRGKDETMDRYIAENRELRQRLDALDTGWLRARLVAAIEALDAPPVPAAT